MKFTQVCFLFLVFLFLTSCNSNNYKESKHSYVWEKKDDIGQTIRLEKPPRKVMSFTPALTEILFALCPESSIVAVSPVCNFPAEVKNKPVVANYPVDQEGVLKYKPDLVFTEVGITPIDVAEQLKSLGVPVFYQDYASVDDLINKMDSLGHWLGQVQRTKNLTDSLRAEMKSLAANFITNDSAKVLVITWQQPIFAYGKNTLMTDKIKLAGGKNAIDQVFDKSYPELTREYILQINPDVLFGGTFEKMDSTFFKLYPELKRINAYKNKHIYALTDDLATRPSPRVLESVKEIKRYLDKYYQTKTIKNGK